MAHWNLGHINWEQILAHWSALFTNMAKMASSLQWSLLRAVALGLLIWWPNLTVEISHLHSATPVLSAPIKAAPRPVKLSPTLQSWTVSAQRTQEARQKFFQSRGPAAEDRPTTREQSGPSESCTNQNTRLNMEEKDRSSALANRKLLEEKRK